MAATLPSVSAVGATPFAGRYRVLRPLGHGTYKAVYLAHDERLDRDVALALVAGAGGERPAARVQREMRVTGRLGDHPNIVTIHDAGEHDGMTYLVLRPMAGGSLAGVLESAPGRRLPVGEAVRIGGQIALALAHAHAHGVVHRDVKPDNVWLGADGAVALGDFGVALTSEGARHTLDQGVVGTVLYLAPEQADERGAVPASDLYALGVTLYELVCGRTPFAGDDALTVISQHLSTAPVAPSWHVPEIPEALERLIVALLAKAPADRPADAAAVAAALAQVADGPAAARPAAGAPLSRLAPGAFVGREAVLALARSACEDALRGRGRILALAGEAGTGKTRCLDELVTFARLRGARVVSGACLEDEGAPALWPWRQILGALGAEEHLTAGPGAAEGDEVEARFRLFDAVAGELRAGAAAAPLVVRLEDLHWADRSSLALLGHLAASLDGLPILVAVTYRSEALRRSTPLADLVGLLATSPAFAEAQLAGFDRAELERYVELTTGMSAGAAAIETILSRTGGNPFFVAETVRMLAAEGRLTAAERPGIELEQIVPPRVQAVLERRIDRLPEGVGDLLAVAAVLGLEFAAAEAARFSGSDRGAALGALETATAERLVDPVAGRAGHFAFVHSTVRDVLYGGLAIGERTRLHAAVAAGLAASPRAASRTAEIAHHAVIAARGGAAAEPAVAASAEAARQATAIHAHAEAAEHLDRALEVADLAELAGDGQRCELLLAAAQARSSAGDLEQGRERAGEAADLARAAGDDEAFVRAALAFSEWQLYGSHDAAAVALLEEALAQAHAPATRATLLGRLAVRLDPASGQARRERLLDEAIALAREVGEPYALSRLLALSPLVRWRPGDRARRSADAAETIALVRSGGDREAALWAHIMRYVDLLERGDMDEARLELEAYGRLAGRLRQPYYRWYLTVLQATRAMFDGELDEGARLAAEAVAYNRAHEPDSEQEFTVQSIMLARLRSRPEDVDVERLREFADEYDDIRLWRALLAAVEADRGDADAARRAYRTCLREGVGALREDADLPGTLAALAHAAVTAGEAEHRDELYARLLPFADRNVVTDRGWAAWGPAALPLGRLAAAGGHGDRAREHFERAIELARAWGARPWLAHAVAAYLESAPPTVRDAPLRAEAREIAAALGLERLARRLDG